MRKTLTACVACLCMAAISTNVQADVVTLTQDFTTADGFIDGPANLNNGITTIVAQGGIDIADAAGTGTIGGSTTGFLRFVTQLDLIDLDALDPGDTIALTATNYQVNRASFNGPLGVLGLSVANNEAPGTAQNQLGLQLRTSGLAIELDEQLFGAAGPVATGLVIGDVFDINTLLTKNADGTFDANSTVGTASLLTADDIALTGLAGIIYQGQGGAAGTFSIDGLTAVITTASVPEPGSASALALLAAGMISRRRRK